jgi:hypothetical protein
MSTPNRSWSPAWKRAAAAVVTLVTILASVVAILDYRDKHPRYDLSGAWTIENTVEHSSYGPYRGGQIIFRVAFTQSGTDLTGVGEKWTEFGRQVSGRAHAPIKIQGKIDGSRIHATFTEQGASRETSGDFDWRISDDSGRWVGTFSSTAAASQGPSILKRYNSVAP